MLTENQILFLKNHLPFFNTLTKNHQELISNNGICKVFSKNDDLLNMGSECTGLVALISGQLRAFITSPEGKEITLYRLIDNDICIMTASCLLKDLNFEINFRIEKESNIILIHQIIYNMINNEDAVVKEYTLSLVSSRFSDVMWVVEQLVFSSMGKRLANFLLEHSALEGNNTLHITHEFIANDLGSAREVITRLLKYFQDDGLVKLSRASITIEDYKRLNQVG